MKTTQLTIFDWMPTAQQEPDVGAWVEKPGAVIPHIMIPSYIGKKCVLTVVPKATNGIKSEFWKGQFQISTTTGMATNIRNVIVTE